MTKDTGTIAELEGNVFLPEVQAKHHLWQRRRQIRARRIDRLYKAMQELSPKQREAEEDMRRAMRKWDDMTTRLDRMEKAALRAEAEQFNDKEPAQ